MTIKEIIYSFINTRLSQEEFYVVRGEVSNVSETDWTCDVVPLDGNAPIKGVRLKPTKGGSYGFILIPTDGTQATVVFESKTKAFLLNADEVDKVLIRNGENGGLINISELVTKLNKLENKVNNLVTYSATHTHTGVTAGGGVTGVASTPVTGSLTLTQVSDLEDDKVLH